MTTDEPATDGVRPADEPATDGDRPADEAGGTDRSVGDALVDRWTALDRGWQALWLGLAIVGIHQLLQPI